VTSLHGHAEPSALKLALLAREARAANGRLLRADPIAIVGMACRVPGAETPERLWQLLRDGSTAIREVPADRWDVDAWYDADPAVPGRAITRCAGFLDHVDMFDAGYFGILEREAERTDPQHRLVLEVACEALDDAGLTHKRLRGSRTGVFVASYHNDYAQLQYGDVANIDERTLVGTLHSVLANRLSWFLDLRGPSLSIDTACSSSLVAVHLACQSLRMGETDCALAGGVSLIIVPGLMIAMSKVGFMSPDGRCKTFDAAADGFGRGEGCGMVVLKRLADAVADGDRVLAVIRGSAVNQDGHSTVLAAPSGPAQRVLLQEALESAQLSPMRISLVEAHGTGTALGDPIEVEAIGAVVGRPAPGAGRCYLGSVKANVGHLEAAAGVVGLIKVVLAMRHNAVPPQPGFTRLSPHLDFTGTRLEVATELTPWQRSDAPRCGAVSSFGVGGTNAHVVLEEAPALGSPVPVAAGDRGLCLPLSARHPDALRELARRWMAFLAQPGVALEAVCQTAAVRRTHHDLRLAVTGHTAAELSSRLASVLASEPTPDAAWGQRPASTSPRVAFVFCGQGPQWPRMGLELFESEPAFREVISECDSLLQSLAGWSLLEELGREAPSSRLDQTEIAQPAIFAMQAGLAAVLRSWGVTPSSVAGHSVGEIAALHQAGVLTLSDALRIAWLRGRIMQGATGQGAMASVALPAEAATDLVRPYAGRLVVAAVNAPRSVVLSGEREALDDALLQLDQQGVTHRELPVNYAFHSPQMEPMQERLVAELAGLRSAAPTLPVYSTVTGGLVTGATFGPAYFGRNVREPVRLAPAIEAMAADGLDMVLEIGPHPVLAANITETLAGRHADIRVSATLRRGRPERASLLQACSALFAMGVDLDWEAIVGRPEVPEDLPSYPWQRQRYWIRPWTGRATAGRDTGHPLLGVRLPLATGATVFEGGPDLQWLHDHVIQGQALLPAAAMMDLLSAAVREDTGSDMTLEDFTIHRPLPLVMDGQAARWQVVVTEAGPGRFHVGLHVATGTGPAGWEFVADAHAVPAREAGPVGVPDLAAPLPVEQFYRRLADLGADFGPHFRLLRHVVHSGGTAQAEAALTPGALGAGERFQLQPALLDAALQLCSVGRSPDGLPTRLLIPVGAHQVTLHHAATGGPLRLQASIRDEPSGGIVADIRVESMAGEAVAGLAGVRFVEAGVSAVDVLYGVSWEYAPLAPGDPERGTDWVIVPDAGGVGSALAEALVAQGIRCRMARTPADVSDAVGHAGHVVYLPGLDAPRFDGTSAVPPDDGILRTLLELGVTLGGRGDRVAKLTVVTRGSHVVSGTEAATGLAPTSAALWGLADVIAVEYTDLAVRCIDLDPAEHDCVEALAGTLASGAFSRIALREGQHYVPRLVRRREAGATHAQRLEIVTPGLLQGVALRPAALGALAPDAVRLQVIAAGVNFRDVLLTLGMYEGEPVPLGAECAGIVLEVGRDVRHFEPGACVFGFVPAAFATHVDVPAAFVAPMPAGTSPAVAAGLPVAYLTAMYGLERLARLQPGERILIHGAAGGVGLAAVQVARRCGAEVFATAGSESRRRLLADLGVQHVMDSRSLGFADEVMRATGGRGVDVVLNSLAGDFIRASLGVLARGGRFVEIGKRGILTREEVQRIRPDASYLPFDLGADAHQERDMLRPMLDQLRRAIEEQSLPPLPVTTYPLKGAAAAFRDMAHSAHPGKLVLVVRPTVAGTVPGTGTVLVTGGLGALGRETARWLVHSGVRSIVLTGRHEPGPEGRSFVEELCAGGADAKYVVADAADRDAMRAVFDMVERSMAPLRGIVHAAGVVHDGALENQDWRQCCDVLAGKAHGALVLHELSRGVPLDLFVLYSAAGRAVGAAGQGVYPAANAVLDAMAAARRQAGLPSLSIAWGPWSGAGMASAQGANAWGARGFGLMAPATAFSALEAALACDAAHSVAMHMNWRQYGANLPAGLDRSFFGPLLPDPPRRAAPSPDSEAVVARLRALPSGARRTGLADHICKRTLQVLGLDPSTPVAGGVPLKDIGLDSLMAVELRNALARSIGRTLPATLLFDYPTLDALAAHLSQLLELEAPAPPPDTASGEREAVLHLPDAEAYDLLLAELDGDAPGARNG